GDFGAINCPKLQAQVGSSDIAVPSPDAVDECAGILGNTAKYYGIDQNIEDFDALRAALGVDKWVVDGVSYGTFTGARYAIGHPTYRHPNPAGIPAGDGDVTGALHEARGGDSAHLNRLLDDLVSGGDPVNRFSSGLHAATLCQDMRFAWGNAATPMSLREPRLA